MSEMSRTRQVCYWVVFVCVAGASIYGFVRGNRGPLAQMPDTPESAQEFICRECDHVFSVTPRRRAELLSEGGRVQREEMTPVRRLYLPCPECGAAEAVVARRCPECDQPFARTGLDGRRHVACSDCEANRPITTSTSGDL